MDGYRDKNGKKDQLGFQAFFVPTFGGAGKGTMFSQFPALDYPVLALTAYHGSLGVDSGLPQNVYQLDTRKMKQFKDAKGQLLKAAAAARRDDDAAGRRRHPSPSRGIKEWASFQISQQPGNGWALTGAIAAIAGLAGSLFIQRRRVWVRAVTRRGRRHRRRDGGPRPQRVRQAPRGAGATWPLDASHRPRRRPRADPTTARYRRVETPKPLPKEAEK